MVCCIYFTDLAVYVDKEGKRSRKDELLWHSNPLSICEQYCWHWPDLTIHFLSTYQFLTLPISLSSSTLGGVLRQWHWTVRCRPCKVDTDYPYQEGVCVWDRCELIDCTHVNATVVLYSCIQSQRMEVLLWPQTLLVYCTWSMCMTTVSLLHCMYGKFVLQFTCAQY